MGFRKFLKKKEEEEDTSYGASEAKANKENIASAQMASIMDNFNASIGSIGTKAADIGKATAIQGSVATIASAGDVAKTAQSAKDTVEAGKAATDAAGGGKAKMAIKAGQEGMSLLGIDSSSTAGGTAQGAMSGMATAASMGMVDPVSLAVAGTIGGISGGLNASAQQKAAYKAAKAKAAAKHHGNLARIEEEKDRKIQGALESMKGAFSRNLQNNKQVKL